MVFLAAQDVTSLSEEGANGKSSQLEDFGSNKYGHGPLLSLAQLPYLVRLHVGQPRRICCLRYEVSRDKRTF